MAAPRIVPFNLALSHQASLFDGLDPARVLTGVDSSAFAVLSAGDFAGRWFERGDVVVCEVGARPGQAVVLVAQGRGRPRLGHQRGVGFTGDRGEPCSPDRWLAAGAVRGVWRRANGLEWGVEMGVELPAAAELAVAALSLLRPCVVAPHVGWPGEGSSARGVPAPAAASVEQLSLFGGGHAARAA